MPDKTPHILITGAGVGGLALAQGLKRNNIPFTVFERDAFLDSRRQGYRLKISNDMAARLQSAITPESWTMVKGTCAEVGFGETNLNATDAGVLASRKEKLPPGAVPPLSADRGLLRQAFMEGIQENVRFGKKLVSYEVFNTGDDGVGDDAGVVRVSFEDGTTAEGTFLVGADGSRSVVRAQHLSGHEFLDMGVCCLYGKSPLNDELQARFPERHRRWITVVRDQTPIIQSIIARKTSPVIMVCEACHFTNRETYPHLPQDYVHFGFMFPRDILGKGLSDDQVDEKLRGDPSSVALDITSEWDPSIRSLIELQDRDLTYGMRILSAPESIPAWETSSRVTAIGDAVHLMSPTGGVGAVAALNDAVLLSKIISEEGVSTSSIRKFEDGMREFAAVCIRRSLLAGYQMLDLPAAS